MAKRDLYDRLGVRPDASPEAIKRAYRRLAKKLHPDVTQDRAAHEHFLAVKEAHEVLANPLLRREYDERLAARDRWEVPPRPDPARVIRVSPPFVARDTRAVRVRPPVEDRRKRPFTAMYTATVAGSSVVFLAGAFVLVAFGGILPGVLSFLMGLTLALVTLHVFPWARPR